MSEKDTGDKEKYAFFIPVAVEPTDSGFSIEWLTISSDRDTEEKEFIKLMEETGARSWSRQDIESDGSTGKKQFFFSGATWKAPWQPKGPKPNWIETSPSEPIN